MCSKEIFFMRNFPISGERTVCVWWVLPSPESCATTARLSTASRNEGDGASLERPELNSERDGQVSTKNRETGRIWSARRGDWKCSLTWNTVWVWELTFLSLGFLYIDCRAKSLLKMVLEKQMHPLVLPLLHQNQQHFSHLVNVFSPAVISNTKERSRTICFSEPKVSMAILSALVAVPFRPSRESISAVHDWHSSLFP